MTRNAGATADAIPASATNDPTVVTITGGTIRGKAYDKSRAFLGIPYAQPPVGDLRWRPPVTDPEPAWSGVRDTTFYPHDCAQSRFFLPASATHNVSEDCLYLSVYAPLPSQVPASGSLPVMVWLHGGGYVGGGEKESRLNATWTLQRRVGAAVIVVPNYRLDVFGFLGSSKLRSRDPSGKGSTGLYGIQDQRAALLWVSRNIAAFGGDPSRVYLVGESAGAGSVSVHLTTPRSFPYFARAGMQSGAFSEWIAKNISDAESDFSAIAAAVNCGPSESTTVTRGGGGGAVDGDDPVVACLMSKTMDELLNATVGPPAPITGDDDFHESTPSWPRQSSRGSQIVVRQRLSGDSEAEGVLNIQFTPVIDGVDLVEAPWALAAAGKHAHVPVIAGSVRDEGASFIGKAVPLMATLTQFQAFVTQVWGAAVVPNVTALYPAANYPVPHGWEGKLSSTYIAATHAFGDWMMSCPARRTARWFATAGFQSYNYVFTHLPAKSALPFVEHATDIPYVFHVDSLVDNPRGIETADHMSDYWLNFAETSNPNVPSGEATRTAAGVPSWPAFDPSAGIKAGGIELAANVTAVTGLKGVQCEFWDRVGYSW